MNKTPTEKDDINRLNKKINSTSTPVILYLILIAFVGSILFLIIDKKIIENDIKLIFRIGLLCLIINALVFTFISSTFSIVKIKQGIIGPKGLNGSKGVEGIPGRCNMCEAKSNTYGIEKNKNNANELVIPQKPLLSQMNLEDKKSGYYFMINDIFQKIVGCREKIVSTEAEALLLLDTIKAESLNSQTGLPNENEITRYLLKIKSKADKGNDNDKLINYPICYGVNYN